MSDSSLLVESAHLSEARAQSKGVREQLRRLEAELNRLASETLEVPSEAIARLQRARLNLVSAIQELDCTDTAQLPF